MARHVDRFSVLDWEGGSAVDLALIPSLLRQLLYLMEKFLRTSTFVMMTVDQVDP